MAGYIRPRALSEYRLKISAAAQRDIDALLTFSARRFGEEAADRYRSLILTGFSAIKSDPSRRGVRVDERLQSGVRLFHLKHTKRTEPFVRRPRHLIVFRVQVFEVRITRVLDERMNIPAHLR